LTSSRSRRRFIIYIVISNTVHYYSRFFNSYTYYTLSKFPCNVYLDFEFLPSVIFLQNLFPLNMLFRFLFSRSRALFSGISRFLTIIVRSLDTSLRKTCRLFGVYKLLDTSRHRISKYCAFSQSKLLSRSP